MKFAKLLIFICILIVIIFKYNDCTNKYNKVSNIRNFQIATPWQLLKLANFDVNIIETSKPPASLPKPKPSRKIFEVTAYDLYHLSGISRGGVDLRGQNWRTIKAIAVDPRIIPLGSKVKLEFLDKDYQKYNGVYKAVDTGGAIHGNIIDFFYEDCGYFNRSKKAINFGRTKAYVEILK